MTNKKPNIGVRDIIFLVLSSIYLVGIKTFFRACDPKEDGSWMVCHWASQAIIAFAIVIAAISVLHLIMTSPLVKAGLSLALIPCVILSATVPGGFIKLCRMTTMRCHTVTRPSVLVISIIFVVVAVIDVIFQFRSAKKAD